MNLETYIERIDAYHEGALTETERLAFESDMESDAELLAAYDLYRQGNEAIEWQIGESLREQLQGWAQEDQRSAAPIQTAVKKVANDQSIDLVVDANTVAYNSSDVKDITADVLKQVK